MRTRSTLRRHGLATLILCGAGVVLGNGAGAAEGDAAPTPPAPASAPTPPPPSRRLNLFALRALKKPVTNRRLDTFVSAGFLPGDTTGDLWNRDFLTGNWDGTRDALYSQGIDLYLIHIGDYYGVVDGGLRTGFHYNSLTLAGTDLFTSRLGWWSGGQFHLTAAQIQGTSIGRDYAGAMNSVYFNDPIRFGARLFELWYGQTFTDNKGDFRIGTMFPFVRIGSSMPASVLTNTSFDYPTFLGTAPSVGLSSAYAAAPFGVQVSYNLNPDVYVISQVSDGYQDPSGGIDNYQNLRVDLNSREGAEGIVELGYKLNQRRDAKGLPGNYKVGWQFHTGIFDNNHLNATGASLAVAGGTGREQRGNSAFYVMMDQMLTQESDKGSGRYCGLSMFLKFTATPNQDVNLVSSNWAAGLEYEGALPSRNHDILALGVSSTRFSDGIRDYDRDHLAIDPTGGVRDSEGVLELAYAAEIAPWWVAIVSLQRIRHPSGFSTRPDATVIGLSNRIAF